MLSEGGEHSMISKEQTEVVQHSMSHKDKPEAVDESLDDNSDSVKTCGKEKKNCESRSVGFCKYIVICLALFIVFFFLKE